MHGCFCASDFRVSGNGIGVYAAVLIACGFIAVAPQIARTEEVEYDAQVINPRWVGGLTTPRTMSVLLWGSDGALKLYRKGAGWEDVRASLDEDLAAAASDDEGRVIVAVGEHGAIARSEDGGRHWARARFEKHDMDLRAVMYHVSDRAWFAAGTKGVLLRSTDGAVTWGALTTGLDVTIQTLSTTADAVLVGGDEGLIGLSKDGGKTWTLRKVAMPLPATPLNSFRWCGKRLIATSALGRIAFSDDSGTSWSLLSTGTNAFFTGSAWDSKHRTLVLTSHTGQVFLSADECKSWRRIEAQSGETQNYLSSVRYDEAVEMLVAVGYHGTVLRSLDGGYRWEKVNGGLETDLESIVGRFASGEGGLIAESGEAGRQWKVITPALSLYLREVVSIPRSQVIVASGELGSIIRSEDSGASWQFVDVKYPNANTPPNLRALVIEPRENVLIAAGAPGTIIRSTDRGRTWSIQHWTALEAGEAFPWSFVDSRSRRVFVLEAHGAVHESSDSGATWAAHPVPFGEANSELWSASAWSGAGVYIAAGQRGAIARSADGGNTWVRVESAISEDLYGSFVDEHSHALFVMGAKGALWRSVDRGLTWKPLDTRVSSGLRRMIRDPRSGPLVVFGEKGTVLRSENAGDTWRLVATNTDAELRKGILEHGTGSLIVLGQQGVVLRSGDGGKSWTRLPSHTRRSFRSAVVNEMNGDIIAVGERIVRFRRVRATSR